MEVSEQYKCYKKGLGLKLKNEAEVPVFMLRAELPQAVRVSVCSAEVKKDEQIAEDTRYCFLSWEMGSEQRHLWLVLGLCAPLPGLGPGSGLLLLTALVVPCNVYSLASPRKSVQSHQASLPGKYMNVGFLVFCICIYFFLIFSSSGDC